MKLNISLTLLLGALLLLFAFASCDAPTSTPTGEPTNVPTNVPTEEPTGVPTEEPTDAPTSEPQTNGDGKILLSTLSDEEFLAFFAAAGIVPPETWTQEEIAERIAANRLALKEMEETGKYPEPTGVFFEYHTDVMTHAFWYYHDAAE